MAGAGPPSTPRGAGLDKGVDGRPAPAMTGLGRTVKTQGRWYYSPSASTERIHAMETIAGHPPLLEVLSTEDEIEAAIGKPAPRILAKTLDSLDNICRAFIARSPFVVVASSDSKGRL